MQLVITPAGVVRLASTASCLIWRLLVRRRFGEPLMSSPTTRAAGRPILPSSVAEAGALLLSQPGSG